MTMHSADWMTTQAAQAAIADIIAALPPNARMGVLISATLPHAGNDDLQEVLQIVKKIEDADAADHWEASSRLASAARDVEHDFLLEAA